MRIVQPLTIDSGNLSLSNVPEVPPALYSGGTTYADGDTASELDGYTYKVYESLVAGNVGNALTDAAYWLYLGDTYAEWNVGTTYDVNDIVISGGHRYQALTNGESGNSVANPAKWLDLGPTNRFLMFDLSNSSQTTNGETIDVTIDATGRVNSVALLNLVASSVQVIVTDVVDGEIYNQTVNLVASDDATNWWEYFFLPVRRYGDWTFLDLPTYNNPTIRIIITNLGGTVKIGAAVLGLSREIGNTLYPSDLSIQDYSKKDVDEFGNYTIIVRNFAKRANLKIHVSDARIDPIHEILSELRATPCLYIGVEGLRSTWAYGFYKDMKIQLAGPNETYLMLDIEGLT